jgi:hypothetical protein
MKYKMAHFGKNKKDMNLLIGAILLITVMVILSVAVDAIAGKTTQFSQIEELTISGVTFSSGNTIIVVVENDGTVPSKITAVWINNEQQTFTTNSANGIIPPKDCTDISILYAYSNGTNYNIKMVSERGNIHLFAATAL